MQITPLEINGCFHLKTIRHEDQRGFFARYICEEEFKRHGITTDFKQCSQSYNLKKGTLRGMHFQQYPKAEEKLVRCISGKIYDVILDLRPDSLTFLKSIGFELSPENGEMLFIAKGIAHGFLTLEDHSIVDYHISEFYAPDLSTGVRWNDPSFNISWPKCSEFIISERDNEFPDFDKSSCVLGKS